MRESTRTKGIRSEEVAEKRLRALGYRVIARNIVAAGVEIDRVAWDHQTLCFIEIRSRRDARRGRPELTIGHAKQRRLVRGAHAFLSLHFGSSPPPARIDVVAVEWDPPAVRVYRNAFSA